MRLSLADKRNIFRYFAAGKHPEALAGMLAHDDDVEEKLALSREQVERAYREYLELSVSEKMKLTLRVECVSDRLHRLMDDICDLKRIDALLDEADVKTLVSLLDMKRKIKERMAKESAGGLHESVRDRDVDHEITELHERICGSDRSQTEMR